MEPDLKQKPLTELISPALFVVESQPADEILMELQRRDDHMAIVIDEFGSAIGMITLEDLLEQVVGEVVNLGYNFEPHLPRRKHSIIDLGENCYRVDGRVLLSDLSERLGVSFASTTAHTVGGLMMNQLRHLPQPGEHVVIPGYRFTVEAVSDKGITSILAEPL